MFATGSTFDPDLYRIYGNTSPTNCTTFQSNALESRISPYVEIPNAGKRGLPINIYNIKTKVTSPYGKMSNFYLTEPCLVHPKSMNLQNINTDFN